MFSGITTARKSVQIRTLATKLVLSEKLNTSNTAPSIAAQVICGS